MTNGDEFTALRAFLARLPAMQRPGDPRAIACGRAPDRRWWVKFELDTENPLAWRHVQELGFVLNYVSVEERLPTVFMPVSPPPYLNGGVEFLSWVIESTTADFTPAECAAWLAARLPDPVDDPAAWATGEDGADEDEDEDGDGDGAR